MPEMVTTTTDTGCVWSFLEVGEEEGEVVEEEVVEEEGVVEEHQVPLEEGLDPRPGAQSTGLWCQVGCVY